MVPPRKMSCPCLICTVLLDPRDPLPQSERTQGVAADPVYVKGEVFAYVGLPQNLKDGPRTSNRGQRLLDQSTTGVPRSKETTAP